MNRAALPISSVALAEMLHLPSGTSIIGAEIDNRIGVVTLVVDHPDLRPVREAMRVPDVYPQYAIESGGADKVTFKSWGQT